MNAVEIIALIFAVIALIKMLVLLVSPKKLMNLAKNMAKMFSLFKYVYLVLAVVV